MTLSKEHKHECDMTLALLKLETIDKQVLKARLKLLDAVRCDEDEDVVTRKAIATYLVGGVKKLPEHLQLRAKHILFAQDDSQTKGFSLLSADDLLTTDWPEPQWAIPDILPVGLTILAGRPKVGKSWLALQIAQAVAAGGMVLGESVEPGPILYLALEDPPRRLKDRMIQQNWTIGLDAEFMPLGEFATQIKDLRNGGADKLARQIEQKGYRLVVIDTLSRAMSGDQNENEAMTIALTPLQGMAHTQNCGVMLVDHHRKMGGDDPDAISDILGSTAKGAMADTAWGLYKKRGKAGAKLAITGRDVEEKSLVLSMDWSTGCWQCEGDADQMELTARRQEILDVLADLPTTTTTTISRAIGQDRGNTHRRLADLANAGLVIRTQKGGKVYYNLPERGA